MRITTFKIITIFLIISAFLISCAPLRPAYDEEKDRLIESSINRQLLVKFKNDARVEILSFNKKIVVLGFAKDESTKQSINLFISSTSSAMVHNEIQVLSDYSKRSWLSSNDIRIESEILSELGYLKFRTRVRVLDGNVYLLGFLRQHQKTQITNFASRISGVREIFDYLEIY